MLFIQFFYHVATGADFAHKQASTIEILNHNKAAIFLLGLSS